MNWVDWVLIAIVACSVVSGLFRGAVRTVLSLAGLAVGFFVASRESGAVALLLNRWMSPTVAAAVGFVLVVVLIMVAFGLAAFLLRRAMEALSLSWLDRLAGAAVGLLRGVAIVGAIALAVEGVGGLGVTRASETYPLALRAGWVLLQMIPDSARQRLHWDALETRIPAKLRQMHDEREIV